MSISLAPGQALETPSAPPPALTQAALDEYGITLFDEAAAAAEAAATATAAPKGGSSSSGSGNGAPAAAAPAFLSDDRPLRDLRRTFAGSTIWKLSLVAKPKKDIGVTEGYLKKRSSSKRLFGGQWRTHARTHIAVTRTHEWNSATQHCALCATMRACLSIVQPGKNDFSG